MRIFLVENQSDTLRYIKMYLESLGHSVTAARTMQEALAAIPSQEFEVLISDIGLPDGNGWDLMEQARFSRSVYAVAISGFGAESDLERSRAAGFRRHIVKPFSGPDLLAAIDEAARDKSPDFCGIPPPDL
jgi:CheY-like chemotaxis protein